MIINIIEIKITILNELNYLYIWAQTSGYPKEYFDKNPVPECSVA